MLTLATALLTLRGWVVLAIGLAAIKALDWWYGGSDGETEHWD